MTGERIMGGGEMLKIVQSAVLTRGAFGARYVEDCVSSTAPQADIYVIILS